MHKHHLCKNSHVYSFNYLTLKTTKTSCKCQLLQQLEIKTMNAEHYHIIIHHSICNLNGKMRNVLSSFTGKATAGHVSRVSYSKNVKPTSVLLSVINWPLSPNEIAIPPPSQNFVYVLTVSATVNLISVDWCAVFLVCCYT